MINSKKTLLSITTLFLAVLVLNGCTNNFEQDNQDDDQILLGENTNQATNTEDQIEDQDDDQDQDIEQSDESYQIPPIQMPKISASIAADVSWPVYINEDLNYQFNYPSVAEVRVSDNGNMIEILGSVDENATWPKIIISSPEVDFYRPGQGTDVSDWVKKHPSLQVGTVASIDGLEAVHYVQSRTSQDNQRIDYYYFIKDGRLYEMSIYSTATREDWPLYNQFLQSFSFEE